MKVKDCMIKDVVYVYPSTKMIDIYKLFVEKQIGGVPVVDKDKRVLGMVTKTGFLDALLPDYFDMIDDFLFVDDFGELEKILESQPAFGLFIAEDLMMRDVITIEEDASLMKAPVIMSKYNVRRIPVVKDGRLTGIITRMDICRILFENSGH